MNFQALAADVSTDSNGRVYGRRCDVTNESEVVAAFAWIKDNLGGADVFVNNAGCMKASFIIGKLSIYSSVRMIWVYYVTILGQLHVLSIYRASYSMLFTWILFLIEIDSTKEDFEQVLNLNVVAACVCTREAIRDMRRRGEPGHVFIVNRWVSFTKNRMQILTNIYTPYANWIAYCYMAFICAMQVRAIKSNWSGN